MMDGQNFTIPEKVAPVSAPESVSKTRPDAAERLARKLGLRMTSPEDLTLRRQKRGKGWSYHHADGRKIRDPKY